MNVSRYFTLLLVAALASAHAQRRTNVDSVRLVTSDIAAFWDVFDNAKEYQLQWRCEDYLERGSAGLRAFAPAKIGDALNLGRAIYQLRDEYRLSRDVSTHVMDAEPKIRAAMRRLGELYPSATYADVYFVIGRFRVGGWARGDTIVIGTEMYRDLGMLPRIVAHELVHRQQPPATDDQTLLERAYHEGSADFIGELMSGGTINEPQQRYGRAHEHELWAQFQRDMRAPSYPLWLYNARPDGAPADLGYFIGYRIAEAYYNRASHKTKAIAEIIRATDIDALLRASGYSP